VLLSVGIESGPDEAEAELYLYPIWSPSGDRVAFHWSPFPESGPSAYSELRLLNVSSGEVTQLTTTTDFIQIRPIAFSPAGDRILYATHDISSLRTGLWSINADGSDEQLLVQGTGWGDWRPSPTQSVEPSEAPSSVEPSSSGDGFLPVGPHVLNPVHPVTMTISEPGWVAEPDVASVTKELGGDDRVTVVAVSPDFTFVPRNICHWRMDDDVNPTRYPDTVDELMAWYVLLAILVVLASVFPAGLEEQANPLQTPEHTKPEWYYLGVYQFLKVIPVKVIGIMVPIVGIALLTIWPFLDRNPEVVMRRRKVAVAGATVVIAGLVVFTIWGYVS
jgi:hypothetical protein